MWGRCHIAEAVSRNRGASPRDLPPPMEEEEEEVFSLIESINALLGGGAVCQNKHTHGNVMPSRRVSQHVGRSRTRGGATCWGFFLSVFMQIVFLFKRRAMRSLPPISLSLWMKESSLHHVLLAATLFSFNLYPVHVYVVSRPPSPKRETTLNVLSWLIYKDLPSSFITRARRAASLHL